MSDFLMKVRDIWDEHRFVISVGAAFVAGFTFCYWQ